MVQLLCSYSTLPLYALVTQVRISLAITSVMEITDSSTHRVEALNPNSDIHILFQNQAMYFNMTTIYILYQEHKIQLIH